MRVIAAEGRDRDEQDEEGEESATHGR
jgi:hypothetical protein